MSKKLSTLLVLIGIIFFQIANLAYWVRFNFLNPNSFVEISIHTLEEPEVREVLAQRILEKIFPDRRILQKKSQKLFEAAMAGILESPLFKNILQRTSQVLFKALTTDVSEGIVLDLAPVKKDILPFIQAFAPERPTAEKILNFPDQIEILAPGDFPPLHKIRPFLIWILILSGLLALIFLGGAWNRARDRYFSLRLTGMSLAISSVVIYFLQSPIRNRIIAPLPNPSAKTIGEALFTNLTQPLKWQLLLILFFGLFLYGWGRIRMGVKY